MWKIFFLFFFYFCLKNQQWVFIRLFSMIFQFWLIFFLNGGFGFFFEFSVAVQRYKEIYSKECHSKECHFKEFCLQGMSLQGMSFQGMFFSKECFFQGMSFQGMSFQGMFFPRNAVSKEFLFLLYIIKNRLVNKSSYLFPLHFDRFLIFSQKVSII